MDFTQYIFPNGRRKSTSIPMSNEIEAKAHELQEAGFGFEIECFPDTQVIHMDCCDEEAPIADESCSNGPDVPGTVEKLVTNAHSRWVELGKPRAKGRRIPASEDNPDVYLE